MGKVGQTPGGTGGMTTRYCQDCRFFKHITRTPFSRCLHPDARDYVGRARDPWYVRHNGPCGEWAKWYEPKIEAKAVRTGWIERIKGLFGK